MKILFILGTRPEAIKMAPLILAAKKDSRFQVEVCSTGQHREMLKPILGFFEIIPTYDLDLMKPGQTLLELTSRVLLEIDRTLEKSMPDAVLVQGDTTTCFVSALAAFYRKIPVHHVEAGLRSFDIYSPFPEEFNRKAVGIVAKKHYAPTEEARQNLIKESFPADSIFVTGNTGIDALFTVRNRIQNDVKINDEMNKKFFFLSKSRKLILSTVHRRESFGAPMTEIFKGLLKISELEGYEIIIPVHMNPEVRKIAAEILKDKACWVTDQVKPLQTKIWLCDPIDYVPFVYLMDQAHLIITDSGGVQEEAPSLGKPILVARDKTERPEAIAAGTSKLIPLHAEKFYHEVKELLSNQVLYTKMAQAKNPFGDGQASIKILNHLFEVT